MSYPLVTAREFALRHKLGAIRDTILPAQTQAAIRRQCPGVSIMQLQNALDAYRFANTSTPAVPANVRKASLERVADLAEQLVQAINELDQKTRLVLEHPERRGKRRTITAGPLLRKIIGSARTAASDILPSPGRPLTRRAYVVRDVARELHRCGYEPDASSKGPLVFIISELLGLVEDPPTDVRSLVRNTLAKIDPSTGDFRHISPP